MLTDRPQRVVVERRWVRTAAPANRVFERRQVLAGQFFKIRELFAAFLLESFDKSIEGCAQGPIGIGLTAPDKLRPTTVRPLVGFKERSKLIPPAKSYDDDSVAAAYQGFPVRLCQWGAGCPTKITNKVRERAIAQRRKVGSVCDTDRLPTVTNEDAAIT